MIFTVTLCHILIAWIGKWWVVIEVKKVMEMLLFRAVLFLFLHVVACWILWESPFHKICSETHPKKKNMSLSIDRTLVQKCWHPKPLHFFLFPSIVAHPAFTHFYTLLSVFRIHTSSAKYPTWELNHLSPASLPSFFPSLLDSLNPPTRPNWIRKRKSLNRLCFFLNIVYFHFRPSCFSSYHQAALRCWIPCAWSEQKTGIFEQPADFFSKLKSLPIKPTNIPFETKGS